MTSALGARHRQIAISGRAGNPAAGTYFVAVDFAVAVAVAVSLFAVATYHAPWIPGFVSRLFDRRSVAVAYSIDDQIRQ